MIAALWVIGCLGLGRVADLVGRDLTRCRRTPRCLLNGRHDGRCV